MAGKGAINRLVAKDFRKQLFILTGAGIYSAGIRQPGLIRQILPGKWVSSMGELPDGRILVNMIGEDYWIVFDPTTGRSVPFEGPDCGTPRPVFGRGMKQQIIPDAKGNLWFISFNHLVKYDPKTNTCATFELEAQSSLFAFLDDKLIVYQYGRNQITFLDLNSGKHLTPEGLPENLDGFVRDLLQDNRGRLWIPTNAGLVRADIRRQSYEVLGREQGFADFRFTAIYEDSRSRLWLGTYFGGLHIFTPETGQITIIDREKGLSDNAIMGIMEDEQGDMWVSTEYGINLVSSEGEVMGSFYREDGVSYEIFDRFDPFKSEDGHIYFGSRNGASLIDPEAFKDYLQRDADHQIYLTELGFFDKKKGEEVRLEQGLLDPGLIEIPPERPYLHLRFGLSSYLEPQKNRYAYMLEGIDKDWTYLGTQPELQINRLPPGKYRILIRGADFRNNWTTEPLAIEVYARQFFYKQAWFYLLLSLPFMGFGIIWARNKQLEARRLEREVAQRTQKIREDKELIEKQAAELRQLDQLKSQFFTNISHELRTPITLIRAPLENVIRKHGASFQAGVQSSLQLILRNAAKLGGLVEELLELSGLEAKKVQLNEISTPLCSFCHQLFSAYESGAALKAIDYRFSADLPENAHFQLDRKRLSKIVNNLLSNALKFTPEGGTIEMRLARDGDQLRIEVQDTGRGIPPEDLPHVFDRYFQTRRQEIATEGGTGIGLALSKELAGLMGGGLKVQSEWEVGSRFTLWLPAKEARAAEAVTPVPEVSAEERYVAPPVKAKNGERPRILVVEDNPDMQQLILALLSEDYECVVADDGAQAWTWLETADQRLEGIQLIMSDVMMPYMDGYTLLEKIKAHERWQRLPVIMLTARSAEEDKLQALRMGVDDYLLKPFSPAELDARLANLIANYRARQSFVTEEAPETGKVKIEFEQEAGADQVWLKEVEDAAREALDKGIKLTTGFLAEKVFLSERQFHRKIKSVTGLTPNGYILEVKLQKARHLLENKVYTTVSEVAAACGFSTGSYLTRVYQEHFGKKPGEYV